MSSFASPSAPSGGITWADHLGHLLLIEPESFESGFKTSFGDADVVKATISDIDSGDVYDDGLIFPKLLVSQTKSQIGAKVLGRLGQGQAKPGQSAPWILEPASEEDIATAEKWLTEKKPTVTSAAAPF